MSEAITWREALALLAPDARREIVAIVERACNDRGKGWIDEIGRNYPTLRWIAELVANNDAAECVTELEKEFGISLGLVRGKIFELHRELREVIDRPRG
jgi:hypothetical protein